MILNIIHPLFRHIIRTFNQNIKYQVYKSYITHSKGLKRNKNLERGLNQKRRLLKNDTQGLLIGCVLQHQKNKSSWVTTGRPNIKRNCSF